MVPGRVSLALSGTQPSMPVNHLSEAVTSAPSSSKYSLMGTRLPSHYPQAYFRSCKLAIHDTRPHEAHTCDLSGPQGLRENKKLELVANV